VRQLPRGGNTARENRLSNLELIGNEIMLIRRAAAVIFTSDAILTTGFNRHA